MVPGSCTTMKHHCVAVRSSFGIAMKHEKFVSVGHLEIFVHLCNHTK